MTLENKNPDELTVHEEWAIAKRAKNLERCVRAMRFLSGRRQTGRFICPNCNRGLVDYAITEDGAITARCETRNCADIEVSGRPICFC